MKKVVYLAVLILSLGLISSKIEAQGFFIPDNELQPHYEKLPPIRMPQRRLPSAKRSDTSNNEAQPEQQPQVILVKRRKISHYVAVDGRYIPVFAEEEAQSVQETIEDSQTAEATKEDEVDIATENEQDTGEQDTGDKSVEDFSPLLKEKQSDIKQSVAEVKKQVAVTEIKKEIPVSQKEPETAVKKADMPSLPQTEEVNSALPDYRNSYTKYVSDLQTFHQTGLFPKNEALSQALSKMTSEKEIVLYKN